jgi:hypothetical protein
MSDAQPHPGNGRAVLLLIAGIPLTMILAASWLWYFVVEGDLDLIAAIGTANHGELLDPPRQVGEFAFTDRTGASASWFDGEPRWTMLMVNKGGVCDRQCERRLYTTRQIHIALGREFNRIRRVVLTDTAPGEVDVQLPDQPLEGIPEGAPRALPAFIDAAHNKTLLLNGGAETIAAVAPGWSAQSSHWYLVDPAGWVMMRFDDSLSYKDIIKDLKFLLKNSGG